MAHVSECFYQKSACDETADKHRSWLWNRRHISGKYLMCQNAVDKRLAMRLQTDTREIVHVSECCKYKSWRWDCRQTPREYIATVMCQNAVNKGVGDETADNRVIMYYIETTAICCHTHFGQFFGSHQTLGGGIGRHFCRFYLAVLMQYSRTTIDKYRIIHNTQFWLETNLQNECILIPPNSVATAAMQTINRYLFKGRWPK